MATESRRPVPSLRRELLKTGYQFGFFQAVRLLQRMQPGRKAVGRSAKPAEEIVRFRARQGLSFPPSEIYSITEHPESRRPLEMTVSFIGLTGPLGVLPRHYSELLLERLRQRDRTLLDFLDLFNHRMISLFYRAWEKHHCVASHEQALVDGQTDNMATYLFALIGLGTSRLQERLKVQPRSLLRYTGLVGQKPHSAESLEHCLADYFGVPVRVRQFIGAWLQLEEEDWTRLGSQEGNNSLGLTSVAGTRVWDQQAGFRVIIGAMNLPTFGGLLPSGTAYPMLVELIKFFAGPELEFDIQLKLEAAEVPACRLASSGESASRLGWTTWLKTKEFLQDAEDVVFSGAMGITDREETSVTA